MYIFVNESLKNQAKSCITKHIMVSFKVSMHDYKAHYTQRKMQLFRTNSEKKAISKNMVPNKYTKLDNIKEGKVST